MNMTKIKDYAEGVFEECLEILESKSKDYATEQDPLFNFRGSVFAGVEPERALLVRVLDKMQRIRNFLDKGELATKGEGVNDSIYDIINYMVLLKALIADSIVQDSKGDLK